MKETENQQYTDLLPGQQFKKGDEVLWRGEWRPVYRPVFQNWESDQHPEMQIICTGMHYRRPVR